VGAFCPYYKG